MTAFFAFEPLITVCSVHTSFFFHLFVQLAFNCPFSCLFYFDWLVCLSQFVKQKSVIYYTFPLEVMCVCVCGCRLHISWGRMSLPHRSHCLCLFCPSDHGKLSISSRETAMFVWSPQATADNHLMHLSCRNFWWGHWPMFK